MADFTLRLPDDLDELVTDEGKPEKRSKHAQIIWILEQRYKDHLAAKKSRQVPRDKREPARAA